MGGSRNQPFRGTIERFKHLKVWTDEEGNHMGQPIEITMALTADALGQRYGVLPTVILEADAEVLKIANIAAEMRPTGG
jgi:hypothetical protein